MGIESFSCRTKKDCELKVALHEVVLGITLKNNDGSEKDQNTQEALSCRINRIMLGFLLAMSVKRKIDMKTSVECRYVQVISLDILRTP